jgi:hypothetical protein
VTYYVVSLQIGPEMATALALCSRWFAGTGFKEIFCSVASMKSDFY